MNLELVLKALTALPALMKAAEAVGKIVQEYKLEGWLNELHASSTAVTAAATPADLDAAVARLAATVNRVRDAKSGG